LYEKYGKGLNQGIGLFGCTIGAIALICSIEYMSSTYFYFAIMFAPHALLFLDTKYRLEKTAVEILAVLLLLFWVIEQIL
jgi:hypothetical protein